MSSLSEDIEEQLVNVFKLGMLDALSTSRNKPNPIPALKEAHRNILQFIEESKQ